MRIIIVNRVENRQLESWEAQVDIKTLSIWSAIVVAAIIVITFIVFIVGARRHDHALMNTTAVIIVLACGYLGCVYLLVTLVH